MSLQQTVDGLLNLGAQVYTAKNQAETEAELARADERRTATDEFQERLFEERQTQANAVAAQGQNLIKYGVFGLLGFGALMIGLKVIK